MKKFLATNDNCTSVAVGVNLSKCVSLVADDTPTNGHIFAFDIETHTCYNYKKLLCGYELMGEPISLVGFDERITDNNRTQFYKLILNEII